MLTGLIILSLFLLSAYFSATEMVLFSLTKYQVRNLEQAHPNTGRIVADLLSHPHQTLLSILLGNTLVNVTLSVMVTTALVSLLGDWGVGIAIGMTTFLLLIFAEVTPKSFGIRLAPSLALWVTRPLYWFVVASGPIRRYVDRFTEWVLAKIGLEVPSQTESAMSQKEIRSLIRMGRKQGVLDRGEEEMIEAVFELGEIPVKEIMTPRVNIVCHNIEEGPRELTQKIRQTHHTRIPIYQETVDNLLGFVRTKQFLITPSKELKELIHPVLFVPETMRIDDLFSEFRKEIINFAIVVDQYGGTSGLVTLEDILEEIVGDIYDEYDRVDLRIEELDERQWLVLGVTPLRELQERLEIELPLEKAETVGGFLLHLLGRFPKEGERIGYGRMEFVAEEVGKKRIHRIRVIRLDSHG